jgi:hypothetical protein
MKKRKVQQSYLFTKKSELYLDMAGSAFVSLDQKGICLSKSEVFGNLEYDKSEELKTGLIPVFLLKLIRR